MISIFIVTITLCYTTLGTSYDCSYGFGANDGRPYARDACQMVESLGLTRQYYKFYCDANNVGKIARYSSDDNTCSRQPIVEEEAYFYQCGDSIAECEAFEISYSTFQSSDCTGRIYQNFSLILIPTQYTCRQIGIDAWYSYSFNLNTLQMTSSAYNTPNCDNAPRQIQMFVDGCNSNHIRSSISYNTWNIGDVVSFESSNCPNYFIRHQNYYARISENDCSTLFAKDSLWEIESGLSDIDGMVSFESINFPGYYLHYPTGSGTQAIKIGQIDDFPKINGVPNKFAASFYIVPALNGRSGYISIRAQSVLFHIRHQHGNLIIDSSSDNLKADDASFVIH